LVRLPDFNGNPWTLEQTDLLVSNGHVHKDILAELKHAGVVKQRLVEPEHETA